MEKLRLRSRTVVAGVVLRGSVMRNLVFRSVSIWWILGWRALIWKPGCIDAVRFWSHALYACRPVCVVGWVRERRLLQSVLYSCRRRRVCRGGL